MRRNYVVACTPCRFDDFHERLEGALELSAQRPFVDHRPCLVQRHLA